MAIPQTFDEAFERAKQLVSIFSENEGKYLSPGYSEAQARLDFIDKFWIALGWDVAHENQTDPYKQEVKVERGVATNEWRKRSDYAFLSPNFRDVRFYVEAKKPHAGIDNPDFYFQTIRYGWNSHTPLAVLTDFEELRVLDCRYKPDIRSSLGHAVLKFHYHDYADKEKFRTIYYLFSRESVLNGSIENFAKGMPKLSRKRAPRGVAADAHQSIDESFLQELDDFREELARAYKRKNPELDSAELTEVTQRTLDRLVFMRFLEDKLIESDPLIEDLHKTGKSWKNFIATSRRLDRVYNGIIFKEHSLLDSDSFKADENVFNKITQSLSHTGSPYDFNAIPIHILGSIYERFLGKVIVATDKRATVKEKPEVRKAGGVYYTPEYIVRYIVDNTVGKLVEGKTPAEIQEMRFADIACGSGSFLLGVYDTLLRYHTAYYNRTKRNRSEGIKAGCIQRPDGALQLSLLQKRQILLNNIYGVDIDPQAVEVAQLSLYLKLLEDETIASAHQQQLAMREAMLPSLSRNIVCGNSLIGWDITEGKLFDTADERGLNPMNFEDAFAEVMKRGGFDAIVGNPPYIRIQTLQETNPKSVEYFSRHYSAASKGNYDIYVVFVERALSLLNEQGKLGYILPHKFFNAKYGEALRGLLSQGRHVSHIVHFGSHQVFSGATTYTTLLFLTAAPSETCLVVKVDDLLVWRADGQAPQRVILNDTLSLAEWNFAVGPDAALFERLRNLPTKLGDVVSRIFQGIIPGADKVYSVELLSSSGRKARCYSRALEEEVSLELEMLRRIVSGPQVERFTLKETSNRVVYPYEIRDGESFLLSPSEMALKYPLTLEYFRKARDLLNKRDRGSAQGPEWYRYIRTQNIALQPLPKIAVPRLVRHLQAGYDRKGEFCLDNVDVGGVLVSKRSDVSDLFILGLLNSKLLNFYFVRNAAPFRGGFYSANRQFIENLPVKLVDVSEPKSKERHDRMVQLVDQMLEARKQLAAARSEGDQNFYESKCATLDRQIDRLVYELYDLTPDEIAIVEGSGQ